jgi:hypothetical protein
MQGQFKISQYSGKLLEVSESAWYPNLTVDTSRQIVTNLLLNADPRYQLRTMYLLYFNPPAEPIVDAVSSGRNVQYYLDFLTPGSTMDFLRVPISTRQIVGDSQFRVTARSNSSVGLNGTPFNSDAPSTIVGAALAASPQPDDPYQDLLFCAFNLPSNAWQEKLANSETGIEYICNI